MKHSVLSSFGCKRMIITVSLLFILSYWVTAQNASYSLNSIPIGGAHNSGFGNGVFAIGSSGNSNSAFGHEALYQNNGNNNSAFGTSALKNNNNGLNNVAIGYASLFFNTNGSYNTAIGTQSIYFYGSGSNNTAIGSGALMWGGDYNTAIGSGAGIPPFSLLTNATAIGYGATVNASNTMQLGNSFLTAIYAGTGTNATLIAGGLQITGGSIAAGKVLTSDAFGVATWQTPGGGGGGNWSLTGNAGTIDGTNFIGTTDNVPFNIRVNNQKAGRIDPSLFNTFYGLTAGNGNTTGGSNTAFGYRALQLNSKGNNNIASGTDALQSNTTGSNNTAYGYKALNSNTTTSNLVAIGYQSLYSNTSGIYNTGSGYQTLYFNTSGSQNTAHGFEALYSNTSGSSNSANGYDALYFNTTGDANTASGNYALYSNRSGYGNVATGNGALYANITGESNTASGLFALGSNTAGEGNSALGVDALYYNSSGNHNTGCGSFSMANNFTGSENTGLGYQSDVNNINYVNTTAIGYLAMGTASNQVRIGNSSVTSIGGYVNWTNISDKRVKKNIKANVPGLDFINKLNPVTYNLDLEASDRIVQPPKRTDKSGSAFQFSAEELRERKQKEQIQYTGFIAQEVASTAKSIGFDFSGVDVPKNDKDLYGLRYSEFVVPLVKAVQELSKQNDILKEENEQLQAQLNSIVKRITTLESAQQGNSKLMLLQSEINNNIARLEQNAPNPFNNNTIIRYNIPSNAGNAQIIITDVNGGVLQTTSLNNKGLGQVVIKAGTLTAGNYFYSLIIDGKKADSKQMILVK